MIDCIKVLSLLNKAKVKYLVVGGIAVNLYGFYRATGDVDLIILMKEKNIEKLLKVFKKIGLVPGMPVKLDDFKLESNRKKWVKEKGLKAFQLVDPKNDMIQLDVVIDHPLNFEKAYKQRKILRDGDLRVPVVSIDDLIQMKKKSGRERDKIDIKALKELKKI